MQHGRVCGEVAGLNTLLEHVAILHVHPNPELESVMLSHELRECVAGTRAGSRGNRRGCPSARLG